MEPKLKKELQKILTALAIFFAMMVVDKTGLCPLIFAHRLPSLFAYLIPYLLCGYDVVRKALLGIRNRQPMDESLLMFVATIGAFATGENSEAVAVMAFYLVGEWFQKYALGKSRKNIASLMDIVPEEANVERADGSIETVDPDDVEIGDILVIKPGEKIPVDAEVLSGESMVNTAALTGESVPRSVHAGEAVISGCINGEGLLRVRATKAFEDSTVSKILELVENASEKKSKTENFITRFARVYTPIVVYSAIALAIIPSILTRDPATWIYRACTFLVVSCPCALVISVPLAFFGGIGAASSNGVLVKGSNYLELLSHLHTVVSDKTGTLTEGNFQVSEVLPAPGVEKAELLRMAALAEGMSTHPIAKSIRDAYVAEAADTEINTALVTDTVNVSGQGLIATLPGRRIFVGNAKLMQAYGIDFTEATNAAATVSYVAVEEDRQSADASAVAAVAGNLTGSDGADGGSIGTGKEKGSIRYLGAILIRDQLKPEAKDAIAEMKREGVQSVVMLTGDRKAVGEAVGQELGLDCVYTDLLPQEKVEKVEALLTELDHHGRQQDRAELAFVGDGINDAPVLARADVGIAMGSMGSDAAIEAADIVIMDDDLARIPIVIRIARRTVAISTQNIAFALFVKILILVLTAFGLTNMWIAVFGDVGVAVLCILNSMRLLTIKRTI
ncbi:heavy metal translocating P-type ATPase [Oribacterium sp. HCP3S3_B9]|uniref:heavy metal translocating P-type ATPase n=1 Tax=Oribacterium sp. HCP3S3_B9 TaxID=3438946 RepID=UPI003F8B38BC